MGTPTELKRQHGHGLLLQVIFEGGYGLYNTQTDFSDSLLRLEELLKALKEGLILEGFSRLDTKTLSTAVAKFQVLLLLLDNNF